MKAETTFKQAMTKLKVVSYSKFAAVFERRLHLTTVMLHPFCVLCSYHCDKMHNYVL